MTHDAAIQTTWGSMVADIRDKLTGMTGWTLENDNSGGATSVYNTDFTVGTPTGEYVKFQENQGYIYCTYGTGYDSGADSVTGTWYNEPYLYEPSSSSNVTESDSVKYWFTYIADEGWVLYVSRNEGDGYDLDAMTGMAELTPVWDFTTANNPEAQYVMLKVHDGTTELNVPGYNANNTNGYSDGGEGYVNPDENFANYPMIATNLCRSYTYENNDNHRGVFGTHDLWIRDRSGNDTAHLDTVEDDSQNVTYRLMGEHFPNYLYGMKVA